VVSWASVTDARRHWITRYLNARFVPSPDQVEVLVRDLCGRREPGQLLRIHGERDHLKRHAVAAQPATDLADCAPGSALAVERRPEARRQTSAGVGHGSHHRERSVSRPRDGGRSPSGDEPDADSNLGLPNVARISARDRSLATGDLEDQAARYHSARHELTINADFRAITDMTAYWERRYEGSRARER
jgi:hypothetical protein